MKRIIIAIILVAIGCIFTTAALAQSFTDRLSAEFREATYGLHLISDHAENRGTNNGNLGVYVRTKSGWTAGHYSNSCNTYTNYYGWTSPEWYRMRVSPVIASGYHCLAEGGTEGKRWSATIIPSVRIYTWKDVVTMSEVSLRMVAAPGLYHLMLEGKFK